MHYYKIKETDVVSASRGFLPKQDPLVRLPSDFEQLERVTACLPKLLLDDHLYDVLTEMPVCPYEQLSAAELERAMLIFSFLGHAFVWGGQQPVNTIPASIAKPWHWLATQLQRPPVLSYASYAMNKWRRLDPEGGIELGNICLLQNFLGGIDEEWFVLIHIDIEAKAGQGLAAIFSAQQAIENSDVATLTLALEHIQTSLDEMITTLQRMPEHCDPYIYYHRVRPYIHGWKDHPALPDGVVYQGVEEYEKKPQFFRGETGAQSGIIPALDAALGIVHHNDKLSRYLKEMIIYMPVDHRNFIHKIRSEVRIRDFILANKTHNELVNVYNACIESLAKFREIHLNYAHLYIQKQSETSTSNPTATGTGGTPFMEYLSKHKKEVMAFVIK